MEHEIEEKARVVVSSVAQGLNRAIAHLISCYLISSINPLPLTRATRAGRNRRRKREKEGGKKGKLPSFPVVC